MEWNGYTKVYIPNWARETNSKHSYCCVVMSVEGFPEVSGDIQAVGEEEEEEGTLDEPISATLVSLAHVKPQPGPPDHACLSSPTSCRNET